jgi:hypothetical protein
MLRTRAIVASICATALAGLAPASAHAQGAATTPTPVDVNTIDPETFAAMAHRLGPGEKIEVDGRLDEAAWRAAPAQGNFIQREPDLGLPATQKTEFRILYDERNLYIGVWAFDTEPDQIIASEMKRDSLLRKSDQIKINLDTFHDKRNGFYFSTNPLGALKDANETENGRVINYDWNAVWKSRTSRDAKGWYVEIAIPFSQLRFKGGPGDSVWGLNICRILLRRNEDSYWVPFPREWTPSGFARMEHAGKLVGLRDLKPRRRVEFTPFAVPTLDHDDLGSRSNHRVGYGFDGRLGVTGSLTADLTFKTDFAQVEADQEVVNLSRFSVFFPEKRQFFTEAAGIFDYGKVGLGLPAGDVSPDGGLLPIFYSRRIGLVDGLEVPLRGGGKITGRVGPYTLGLLNIQTEDSQTPDGRTLSGGNYTVLRAKRNIFRQSTVGGMFLNRQGGPGAAFNRTAALDTALILGRNLVISGMLAKTLSPSTVAHGGDGAAGAFNVAWKSDQWDMGATYLDVARDFSAEMGFITRTDIKNPRAQLSRTWRPQVKGVRSLRADLNFDRYDNHDRVEISRGYDAAFTWQRPNGASTVVSVSRDFDRLTRDFGTFAGAIRPGAYWWNTYRASYTSSTTGAKLGGSLAVEGGGYYGGRKQTLKGALNIVPNSTLLIEGTYTRNQLELPGLKDASSNVIGARVSYSFSPNLFVKAFAQMNDERKLASVNLLLWYIYRPGSDLYVVYNQGFDQDLPGLPFLRSRQKSLTVKMTWWWSR